MEKEEWGMWEGVKVEDKIVSDKDGLPLNIHTGYVDIRI